MKSLTRHTSILLAATLLSAASTTQAAPAGDAAVTAAPARGATMGAVERNLGKPAQVLPAVGDPPITRWVYPAFTVYFEHQYVIHSVIPAAPGPAAGP